MLQTRLCRFAFTQPAIVLESGVTRRGFCLPNQGRGIWEQASGVCISGEAISISPLGGALCGDRSRSWSCGVEFESPDLIVHVRGGRSSRRRLCWISGCDRCDGFTGAVEPAAAADCGAPGAFASTVFCSNRIFARSELSCVDKVKVSSVAAPLDALTVRGELAAYVSCAFMNN
jgi:hypothetical protein